MYIEYNLLPTQKRRKQGLKKVIDLYPKATELYSTLDRLGLIERIKDIPQLGLIKVSSKLSKSRYDYILLQLYLHQIIKKNIQGKLKYTYNNVVSKKEFLPECVDLEDSITIADIIQCLVIAYNIGHFYNTFTASRAVLMLAAGDETFLAKIKEECKSSRFSTVCNQLIGQKDHRRLHLLNTLIILERCEEEQEVVKLTREIIYAYLDEARLSVDSKLHYIFELFRTVRNNAYIAYDLQIANTPFTLDLWNEKAILNFFEEQLSEFNNKKSSTELVKSIQKMLDSVVYNENSNAICYYQIARAMYRKLVNNYAGTWFGYYNDYFVDKDSYFNRTYSQRKDYKTDEILKITFENERRSLAENLIDALEHKNNVRVGYYDRANKETTILVSIKNSCGEKSKIAFKIMQLVVSYLRLMKVDASDGRYILVVKFFLYYLFGERKVVIKPTINKTKCVFCTRGKTKRVDELLRILSTSNGNEDDNHEIEAIINRIKIDTKNDTCITVPGSTIVYNAEEQKLCEIDGIIIYPQRNEKQVTLVEAKNTNEKPNYGSKCLLQKLKYLEWNYNRKEIQTVGHDAYYEFSVGDEVKESSTLS